MKATSSVFPKGGNRGSKPEVFDEAFEQLSGFLSSSSQTRWNDRLASMSADIPTEAR